MISKTKKAILDFLTDNPDSSTKQVIERLGISKQAVARHLSELQAKNLIYKKGRPPKVYYSLLQSADGDQAGVILDLQAGDLIERRFLVITPLGDILRGSQGFALWCRQRGLDMESKSKEYLRVVTKYDQYKNNYGLIEATQKVRDTFGKDCYLDELYYSEFSAYEIFGATDIYKLLLHAKIAQNRPLMLDLLQTVKEKVISLIIQEKIDAVGFIPPSVPRGIQLQKEFERFLNLPLPVLGIHKIHSQVIVAQKTLKDPRERIENSIKSFVVDDRRNFGKVLLIDDFVGSGSSLNFTAQKVRAKMPKIKKVIGFAIAGTPNGVINKSRKFEVLSEA